MVCRLLQASAGLFVQIAAWPSIASVCQWCAFGRHHSTSGSDKGAGCVQISCGSCLALSMATGVHGGKSSSGLPNAPN